MSKNLLPVVDLANIATLPFEQRRPRLLMKRAFVPPHSLEWTRRNLSMLIGVSDPLFPEYERPIKEVILKRFEAKLPKGPKRAEAHRKANLRRATALLDLRDTVISRAAPAQIAEHSVGPNYRVKTAEQFVIAIDGKPVVPSVDLRASGSLSARGVDFYFAMNFHMAIDRDVELENYGLALLDYYDIKGTRGFRVKHWDGVPRYSYDELDNCIRETLELWDEIVESRKARSAGEDPGEWFGKKVG